ncbi:MAG: hypothetical protein QME05_07035, partial [Candidatus Margulisbacteria bacterium]|nr:hypothetical protein [Candidatus Margulisiibacteriota bacterium]
QTFELTSGSGTAGMYGLFYRYPSAIGTGIQTTEVNVITNSNYSTMGSGANFSSAMKVNDWLSIGFASNSPTAFESDLSGAFPITARFDTNLYGQTMGAMQINNAGKLSYTFSGGGIVTTYESTQALWSGFLSQEATLPLTSQSILRDSINIESPYLGTIASHIGNFSLGLNVIPIAASANIDNTIETIINTGTDDIFLYTPDFDPDNQSDVASWMNDPDLYGTSSGYTRKTINLPQGEIVATSKYRGYYSASTARFDLGGVYDFTDYFSIGFAMENTNNAALNFTGTSIANYINYRNLDTAEAVSLQNLLQPGGKSNYDIITDTWTTTDEVSGTKLYLEPGKNYNLSKKIRYGIALKKPFLIALDYEQNQTPIYYQDSTQNITVTNMNFIKIGGETRILMLPMYLRGATVLLLKPTVTGASASTTSTINSAFRFGMVPVRLDLGTYVDAWGTQIGVATGVNAMPVIYLLQLDTIQADLSKISWATIFLNKDYWQIDYRLVTDALASAAAYASKTADPVTGAKNFEVSDVKFVQTLGITYRF